MNVRIINSKLSHDFILNKHYAQRLPSISFAFGLFIDDELEGICTIGKPASPYLCKGICGNDFSSKVYELNRLCVNEGLPKNTLSIFVSKVLKQLKSEDLILVSYADEAMNHCGYIYQATNWIYTGKTKSRTDKYTKDGKHSRHYDDGYSHLRVFRSSKHRYVYFTGKSKKIYLKNLKYDIVKEYPKINPSRYKLGEKIKRKIIDKNKGIEYFE